MTEREVVDSTIQMVFYNGQRTVAKATKKYGGYELPFGKTKNYAETVLGIKWDCLPWMSKEDTEKYGISEYILEEIVSDLKRTKSSDFLQYITE
jgi:hypothetical protein